MKHAELVSALVSLRGSGAWQKVAARAEVDYFTVARIARGEIANPGVKTCEQLAAALKALGLVGEDGRVRVRAAEAPPQANPRRGGAREAPARDA